MTSRSVRGWFTAGVVLAIALAAGAAAGQEAAIPADQLLALGKKVEARVAVLRGLAVLKPIRFELTSKERVRAYLKESLAEQYGPGELEKEGLGMKALGLVPRDLDFENFVVGLYEEQVGGYYDPKKEIFYLADWIPPAMQETIIAHELTHVLQDQHFDIDKFLDRIRGNSDAMYAHSAVVEGEATLVMMLDALRNAGVQLDPALLDLDGPMGDVMMGMSAAQYPEFGKAPRALRETLLFPYLKGLGFVTAGRSRGGWERVDKIYSDLPESTEQVMHPEKYFEQRDAPQAVSLAFLDGKLPKGWEQIYEDVLGEFATRLLLDGSGDRDQELRAAAGWDGDRYRVWRRGDELAWAQLSVWDSEQDATEFAASFARTAAVRLPGAEQAPLDERPRMEWRTAAGRVMVIARAGARVWIAVNLEATVALALEKAALAL